AGDCSAWHWLAFLSIVRAAGLTCQRGTDGFVITYASTRCRWGLPPMMQNRMRDDVFGLSSFRTIAFGAPPKVAPPLSKSTPSGAPSFANELKRATNAHAATQTPLKPKPYVSPMKRSNIYEPREPTSKPTTLSNRPTTAG